ncbi:kinesin-like protein KIF20A isoform X3 [Daktulosphaira vitifoliae]|uniref:kinesin-like protein KIF20A isoform X3 n=1 Tax=Daktulosphaira vitifoliae TaxID=58002 RepID=UPI0021AADC4C|nr:kinesin-like protein KIF20A isoform X3 [Daktulosphaira vitifoliae]
MDDSKEHLSTGSYVEPRIPSITGFGQRKVIGKPKKVLDYSIENVGHPKIDVCLRIKPRQCNNVISDNTLTILSDTTVACCNGHSREDVTEYTFSSVFGPNVDQKKFFNTWVYEKVLRFLNGNSELLFAYGTTNAGKTFTIHGTPSDPGLIPRTLQLVFGTLNDKLMAQCKYKPDKVNAAHILDENLMECEENVRQNILSNWTNDKNQGDTIKCSVTNNYDEGSTVSSIDQLSYNNITKMFEVLKNDENAVLNHGDVSYSVWVTYSEIYNETIYDLLVNHSNIQKRTPLKLSFDQNKNVYVRDLTHVCVKSAEEAYKIMSFGRNNLKIASNNLNKLSSRSHCIFTLKLMRVENIIDPKTAITSSISFCDLAGSERLKKTMNIGDRLKESKNINTSLLVLNKCFSVLRENQKRGENNLVPYRESKLTQMFQTALMGTNNTGISMAVNVDTSPNLYEETKQVLFMSAIVRAIAKTKTKKPRPSFAVWVTNNHKNNAKGHENINEENDNDETNFGNKSMADDEFEIRLNEEKTMLRKEMISQFQKMLEDNNLFWQKQKETTLKNKTDFYENKIKRLKQYYAEEIRDRETKLANINVNTRAVVDFDIANNKSAVENYEFRIGELEIQKEELISEINTLKNVNVLCQEDLNVKNQEIENYKSMIVEANTEYEKLERILNDLSDRYGEMSQELDEKDLEIERLNGAVYAKDSIITEMELNQEILAEQKIIEYMDEKLETIASLNATIKDLQEMNNTLTEENMKLKGKYKKCREEQVEIARQFKTMRQNYKEVLKSQANAANLTNDINLSTKITDQDVIISKLKENIEELEYKLKENENISSELKSINQNLTENLKTVSIKPEMKSIGVLTDSEYTIESEGKENEVNSKCHSDKRPQRKCRNKTPSSTKKEIFIFRKIKHFNEGTPDMCDKLLDDAINNISKSTKKRILFDSKPPLTDSSNMVTDNALDFIPTPARALHHMSKLRKKK